MLIFSSEKIYLRTLCFTLNMLKNEAYSEQYHCSTIFNVSILFVICTTSSKWYTVAGVTAVHKVHIHEFLCIVCFDWPQPRSAVHFPTGLVSLFMLNHKDVDFILVYFFVQLSCTNINNGFWKIRNDYEVPFVLLCGKHSEKCMCLSSFPPLSSWCEKQDRKCTHTDTDTCSFCILTFPPHITEPCTRCSRFKYKRLCFQF